MVKAPNKNASIKSVFIGLSNIAIWMETTKLIQDTLEGLYLSAGLDRLGILLMEPEEVAGDKEAWQTLISIILID